MLASESQRLRRPRRETVAPKRSFRPPSTKKPSKATWKSRAEQQSRRRGQGAGAHGAAALAAYLESIQKTDRAPDSYAWIARLERANGIVLDNDDPSLEAKRALIDLETSVNPVYDFSLPGVDGKNYSLSNQRGRVVLLNFWATWCPPCRKEMPALEKIHRDWAPRAS